MSIPDQTPLLAVLGLSGGELILITTVLLVLFGVFRWRTFFRGLRMGVEEFLKASGDVQRGLDDAMHNEIPYPERSDLDPLVWIAQGFGAGRLKPAPGTWGSLVGLLWFAVLVATGSVWGFFVGILLSIPLSVALCGIAEKVLGEKDPGSVVLDEIIAVPVCFSVWLIAVTDDTGQMPTASHFFTGNRLLGVVGIFAAFRLFDIWKPWPVRQSQSLPGGWGVTVDDLLAALYVNLVSLPFLA